MRDLYSEVQVLPLLSRLCHGNHTSVSAEIDDIPFRVEQVTEDQHWHRSQDSPVRSMFPGHQSVLSVARVTIPIDTP